MPQKQVLEIVPVTRSAIIASRKQIFVRNPYAADALHATIALTSQAQLFITFDGDFKGDLGKFPIVNPMES